MNAILIPTLKDLKSLSCAALRNGMCKDYQHLLPLGPTRSVGLDVHKKTISVAMVEGAAGATVRFYGTVNTPD